jgi:hypothetical protein
MSFSNSIISVGIFDNILHPYLFINIVSSIRIPPIFICFYNILIYYIFLHFNDDKNYLFNNTFYYQI